MKILNLVILSITIALGVMYGPAQDREGSVTFTDRSNRTITISRFGTVLSFKNSNGKEIAPANIYRICPCGDKGPCIESATTPSKDTISKFEVESPKKGTTLEDGETLVVTATFRQGDLTVMRRLTWVAGSSSVKTEESISASKPLCPCTFEDKKVLALEMKMCPGPPGFYFICPPLTEISEDAMKQMKLISILDFSK